MTQRELPPPRAPDPKDAPAIRWGILAPGGSHTLRDPLRRRHPPTDRRRRLPNGARPQPSPTSSRPAGLRLLRGARGRPRGRPVYVASPHSEHRDHALLALEAGKPVLVEKAFTRSAAEARDCSPAADRRGCFVVEAMWSRFLPHYDVVHQSSRPASSASSSASSPTTASGSTPTVPPGSRSRSSRAGRCSTSASTPCRSPTSCSARRSSVSAAGTLTDLGVDATTTITVTGRRGRPRRPVLHDGRRHAVHRRRRAAPTRDWTSAAPFAAIFVQLYDRDGVLIDRHDPSGDATRPALRGRRSGALPQCWSHRVAAAPARNHSADNDGNGRGPPSARGPLL